MLNLINFKKLALLMMSGKIRKNIKVGMNVSIIQKQDQRTGKVTQGTIKKILTNSSNHPHGIKVRLTSGKVGRVKQLHPNQDIE